MKWHLVKIIYQIICGEGNHTAQFDEQLRLVAAEEEAAAVAKAISIGRQEEEIFHNDKKQLVQWKFLNVAEVYTLDKLLDGAELYSQIKEAEDAEAYRSFVDHKAQMLRKKYIPQPLQTA